MIAVEQEVACDFWYDIGEEGQHKDFSIVEDMAAIAEAGQSFSGNAVAAVMG